MQLYKQVIKLQPHGEAYATLKDLPGHARAGQFGAVNRVVGAWDVYRRYPFTICGGVLLAAENMWHCLPPLPHHVTREKKT